MIKYFCNNLVNKKAAFGRDIRTSALHEALAAYFTRIFY
jgi:hypothetical protein